MREQILPAIGSRLLRGGGVQTLRLPDQRTLVKVPGGEALSARAEVQPQDRCGRAAQFLDLLAAFEIPELHRQVLAPRRENRLRRMKGQGGDRVVVRAEFLLHLERFRGAQAHHFIRAGLGDRSAVRRHREAIHGGEISRGPQLLPGRAIAQHDLFFRAGNSPIFLRGDQRHESRGASDPGGVMDFLRNLLEKPRHLHAGGGIDDDAVPKHGQPVARLIQPHEKQATLKLQRPDILRSAACLAEELNFRGGARSEMPEGRESTVTADGGGGQVALCSPDRGLGLVWPGG